MEGSGEGTVEVDRRAEVAERAERISSPTGDGTARWRLAAVIALALLAVAYRGMSVYMKYFSPDLRTRTAFHGKYEAGALVVDRVEKEAECARPEAERAGCLDHPHPGDRIVEIRDGKGRGGPIRGTFDLGAYLKPINARESWTLVVDRPSAGPEGASSRLTLRMPPAVPLKWSVKEWVRNLGFDVYLPLLALAAGSFIGLLRPQNAHAFQAALVFLFYSVAFGQDVSQFPPGLRDMALVIRVTALAWSPYLILRFFLGFPRRSPIDRRAPWIRKFFFGWSACVWVFALTFSAAASYSLAFYGRLRGGIEAARVPARVPDLLIVSGWIAMIVVALVSLAVSTVRAESRDDRRRLVLILAGAVLGLIPAVALHAAPPDKLPTWVLVAAIPLIGLFPILFVTAVVRHRLFGIRLIVRRGLQYALLSRGFLIFEGILIFLALYFALGPLVRIAPDSVQSLASVGIAAATLGLVLGTRRVNRFVLPALDRRFFRDAYNAERVLADLVRAVKHLASRPERLLERIADEIVEALHPTHVAVFLADEPWPGLAARREEARVAWAPEGADGDAPGYLLLVHREVLEDGERGEESRSRPDDVTLFSRTPISRLLSESAAGEAEVLDVFPASGSPARSAPPAPGDGLRLLSDRDLFELFDARLVLPLATEGKALGFVVLGQKLSDEHYTHRDRALLLAVAEQASIALDYSRMIERAAEQQKLEREIQIAQDVQTRLLPQDRPALPTLRYTGICRPARGVGGDYYDFLPLGPGRLGIVVADIAGKGLPAALLMASLQALVRSHAAVRAADLSGLAAELNRHLCESTDDARFATIFFGVYDDGSRRLRYLNAGHNPPILIGSGGKVRRLVADDTILGSFPEQRYHERFVDLAPGDLLVVFSDGIVEAMDEREREFGDPSLVDTIRRHAGDDPDEVAARILDDVGRHVGKTPPHDDMTLIVARVA